MNTIRTFLLALFIPFLLVISSCGNGEVNNTENTTTTEETVQVDEFEVLVSYLERNGDFINSKKVPAMIKTTEVFENMENEKFLIIDVRGEGAYNKGHILNAENVKIKNLINYFSNDITAIDFDKIVLVCYSGQSASFATGVLRLIGYDNVYAMKFGMSSWNVKFADEVWNKHVSNDYADQLETTNNPKPEKGAHPTISTGKTEGYDILMRRAKDVLELSYKTLLAKSPEVFAEPSNYFIVNYWPEAKYSAGHIPTSIRYQPKKSLASTADLYTLPIDKEIVTYCFTGQHAAFVTGYLNILGYNAKALAYGANGFMNGKLKEDGSDWHPWSNKKIHDYDFVIEDVPEVEEAEGEASCG